MALQKDSEHYKNTIGHNKKGEDNHRQIYSFKYCSFPLHPELLLVNGSKQPL